MKRYFLALLVLWIGLVVTPAHADLETQLSVARSQLESLKADDPETQPIRERYQQLIKALEGIKRQQAKAEQYRQLIEQQPRQIAELKAVLAQPVSAQPLQGLETKPLAELRQLSTVLRAKLIELESARSVADKTLRESDNRLINLREQLGLLRVKAEADNSNGKTLTPLEQQLQKAQSAELKAQVQALELELLILPGTTELTGLKRQQLERQITELQPQVTQIEEVVQVRQRDEAEKALSELEQPPEAVELPPELEPIQQQNLKLGAEIRELLAETEAANSTRNELNQQLKALDRSRRTIEQQLALDIGYMGGEMRRLMLSVTKPLDTRQTFVRINQLRLLNLEQEQSELDEKKEPVDDLDPALEPQYQQLMSDQQKLHDRLNTGRQQLIGGLSELLTVQEAYNEQLRQSSELLNKNLLWHPSLPRVDSGWPGELRDSFSRIHKHWTKARKQPLLQASPWLLGGLIMVGLSTVVALLLWRYRRSRRMLWYQQRGNVMQDSIKHTLKLLVMAPLIAAPIPLLMFVVGWFGLDLNHPYAEGARWALILPGLVLWVALSLLQWLTTPDGLFSAHLSVPQALATTFRRHLLVLLIVAFPLLALDAWLEQINDEVVRSGIARLTFILVMLLLMTFWLTVWWQGRKIEQKREGVRWWGRSKFWVMVLVVIQLIGIGLSLWGYALTAEAMVAVLMMLLLTCLAVYCFHHIGLRWLLIAERKLAFERARARRAEIIAARENNEDEPPPEEENLLDLQTISDQARVLLTACSYILLFALLWWQLGDLLPTLVVLDDIELWSSTTAGAEGEVLKPITLGNFLVGLLIIGLSLLGAKNLPGLLELLVLRHLTLAPGTGYAITTMLKYALIMIGATSGLGNLGFEWSKLQWLVAALGVGLGFGLQEIVANFVSGVIILFEKPVRIGDTVTVGNLTGVVSRIQIRATTITDWDLKEVIIPNKTFITDQLINWSLSDAMTRVVIPVGVAYGSNTALVRSLLLEVALSNKRLLREPEPQAFFLGFGDSCLNFDLRVYVAAMGDRLEVAHQLNEAIHEAFRQNGIEIPFPQMDVHLPDAPQGTQSGKEA